MLHPRLLASTFVFALALCLSSCTTVTTTDEHPQLELVFDNPKTALPYSIAISVGVRAPDRTEHRATGEASQSAVITAVCRSLTGSLEARGCIATYRDLDEPAENETGDQKLRRAMRQVVELPEGWTFVFAHVDRKIGHENIADNGGSGDLVLTLCSDR